MKKNKNLTIFHLNDIFFSQSGSDFVLGRPGKEEFVPGFSILPLSQDRRTPENKNVLVPGHPVPLETLVRTANF